MTQQIRMTQQQGMIANLVSSTSSYIAKTPRSLESRQVGVEIELQVLDSQYQEVNRADEIIALAQSHGLNVVAECSKSMIELISSPDSANNVVLELSKDYLLLCQLAESIGLVVLPLDYPLTKDFNSEIRSSNKFDIKRELLGESFSKAGLVCGMHMHFDLDGSHSDILRANFLKLIEPIVASLTSTTPQIENGIPIQNWRLYTYRSIVYGNFKEQGGLTSLTKTFNDFIIQMSDLTEQFKSSYMGSIPIDSVIGPVDGVWGSLRFKPDIQTIELRSPGAVPDFTFLNLFTTFLDRFNVLLSTKKIDLELFMQLLFDTTSIDEASLQLHSIADESIIGGLNSLIVHKYISDFLSFFNDQTLSSLYQQLVDRKKIRDVIVCSPLENAEKYALLYNLSQQSAQTNVDNPPF